MARIAIGGFQAEINSFFPQKTAYSDFIDIAGRPYGARTSPLIEAARKANWGISGFIEEAERRGDELVATSWAFAQPAAELTDEAFDRICGDIIAGIAAAGPLDAVFLCLHGAMITESFEDAEAEILRRVRAVAGGIPVVATLDLHANVTQAMVALADLLIVYRTYPHIDMADCGREAARLLHAMLESGKRPAKAFRKVPFLIPAVWQCTTIEPSRTIFASLLAMQRSPVVSLSFAEGFPPSDIRDCGPAVIAYADDAKAADEAADSLSAQIAAREADFAGRIYAPDAAIAEAARLYDGRPVVFADSQDNPGGGGSSDTVGLLKALAEAQAQDVALAVFYDPDAATAAHAAGIGASLTLSLGAKVDAGAETPFRSTFTVEALSDGNVVCNGPMMRGKTLRHGPTALLRTGGIQIVVASARIQPYDTAIFRHLGLDPSTQRILALKSAVHFRNDFEQIACAVLVVDSPGFVISDHRGYAYRRLRQDVRLMPRGPTLAELGRGHG